VNVLKIPGKPIDIYAPYCEGLFLLIFMMSIGYVESEKLKPKLNILAGILILKSTLLRTTVWLINA